MHTTVVWFKRDLRVHDHLPLQRACQRGAVLCLYVAEPSLWQQPDSATQHYQFIAESLQVLDRDLASLGAQLLVRTGEVTEVLQQLHAQYRFTHIESHEETGNHHTFERDKAVARWCHHTKVQWAEHPQFGVVRRLASRNQWQLRWEAHMGQPTVPTPTHLHDAALELAHSASPARASNALRLPTPLELGLLDPDKPHRQRGGRHLGLAVLHRFIHDRSAHYRGGISSPLLAPSACSRVSTYLSYGCLSMREVVHATRDALAHPHELSPRSRQGIEGFVSRLYWHCHFIQKLESQPDIEWRNLHRGYDGLREHDWQAHHFEVLQQGRTGWPMVDACVAMLRETGWLNFRMRAMLVSVAAYPLWLHWREVGLWLAREFLDYEPGIHWSQLQMQSGTTGINTTRVYNPIKQAQDHDPHGRFVRQWLPYMRTVPDSWLLQPWRMPPAMQASHTAAGPHLASAAFPQPVVDLDIATRAAKQRVHALRAQPQIKAAKAAIVQQHASRRGAAALSPRTRSSSRADNATTQLDLDF